jgi:hypothetical protein
MPYSQRQSSPFCSLPSGTGIFGILRFIGSLLVGASAMSITLFPEGPSLPLALPCVYLPPKQSKKGTVKHHQEQNYEGRGAFKKMREEEANSDECCCRNPAAHDKPAI